MSQKRFADLGSMYQSTAEPECTQPLQPPLAPGVASSQQASSSPALSAQTPTYASGSGAVAGGVPKSRAIRDVAKAPVAPQEGDDANQESLEKPQPAPKSGAQAKAKAKAPQPGWGQGQRHGQSAGLQGPAPQPVWGQGQRTARVKPVRAAARVEPKQAPARVRPGATATATARVGPEAMVESGLARSGLATTPAGPGPPLEPRWPPNTGGAKGQHPGPALPPGLGQGQR